MPGQLFGQREHERRPVEVAERFPDELHVVPARRQRAEHRFELAHVRRFPDGKENAQAHIIGGSRRAAARATASAALRRRCSRSRRCFWRAECSLDAARARRAAACANGHKSGRITASTAGRRRAPARAAPPAASSASTKRSVARTSTPRGRTNARTNRALPSGSASRPSSTAARSRACSSSERVARSRRSGPSSR